MGEVDYQALHLLLKASSKETVNRLCNEAYLHRHSSTFPATVIQATSQTLTVDKGQSRKLLISLSAVIKSALFSGSADPGDVAALFPDDFHKNLRDLLVKIIATNLPTWKNAALNSLVSLPRLEDFDWRVDVKTSSDTLSRMSVPTCILQLQVQEPPTETNHVQALKSVNVELSKETLDTMLDGLGKIRDQLSSVAGR